jgi:hypothetical protein
VPNSVSDLKRTTFNLIGILWLGVNLRLDTNKMTCVEKRLSMCSNFVNRSRHNSQHN